MGNNYVVGNVVSIDGLKIKILMNEQSNLESFHFNGILYNGRKVCSCNIFIRFPHIDSNIFYPKLFLPGYIRKE